MKNIIPYLTFNGNCQEALDFYSLVLGGRITFVQRFAESPMSDKVPDENLIMHSEFSFGESKFFASDSMPGQEPHSGNKVTLCIGMTDADESRKIFDALADRGQVQMPLEKAFWGALFGMLRDKYGICWMLSCQTEPMPGHSS